MTEKARDKIEHIETELAILREQGELKGYILAVLPDDGDVLIAHNATTIEVFGLAQAVVQHNVAGRGDAVDTDNG